MEGKTRLELIKELVAEHEKQHKEEEKQRKEEELELAELREYYAEQHAISIDEISLEDLSYELF